MLGPPWWFNCKESACSRGDVSLIPGLGRFPGEGNGYPLQYSSLENPHGQSSLAGYSPWGHKELDMTEGLSRHEMYEALCWTLDHMFFALKEFIGQKDTITS